MKKFFYKYFLLFFIILSIFLSSNFVFSENSSIIINEICPTGCASSDFQWLEIYNSSDEQVNLESWIFFEQNSNHSLKISSSSLKQSFLLNSQEYAIICQNDEKLFELYPDLDVLVLDSSWSTLNKSGEEIGLKDSSGNFIEKFVYKKIENNKSLERINFDIGGEDQTNWAENPDSNSIARENFDHNSTVFLKPKAIISAPNSVFLGEKVLFSASSSYSTESEIENYYWDFGNGEFILGALEMEYIFLEKNNFTIRLKVVDKNFLEDTSEIQITVLEKEELDISTTTLVINEIYPNPSEGKEWLELFCDNPKLNLKGYTLWDGISKIFTFSDDFFITSTFFTIELASAKLNNDADSVHLKNDQNELVDEISYGLNLKAPQKGNSLARIIDGFDTDNFSDFRETKTISKSFANIIFLDSENSDILEIEVLEKDPIKKFFKSNILINEIVSDPGDEEAEFVELYNNTNEIINLKDWFIEEGSASKTFLSGEINPFSYFVVENIKGNLNNSGDLIILFSPDKTEIDKITYGNYDDGNLSDNAPVPKDPHSLIRKIEGLDSDNDIYDFVLTNTITKGEKNILILEEAGGFIGEDQFIDSIIINEIYPNPFGDDSKEEFIELKNIGKETINLDAWKLGDSSKTRYSLKDVSLKAGEIKAFFRENTKIALNNSGGEEVKLFSKSGLLLETVKYVEKAEEGLSYARKDDGNFVWTTEISPDRENVIKGKAAKPIISIDVDTEVITHEKIIFDASDTIDPFNLELEYEWDFGDGSFATGAVISHTYLKEGIYSVLLKVSNSENEAEKKVIINVKNILDFNGSYSGMANVEKIQISEILPNPEGSDTNEFIELYNPSDIDIDISGLKLDDEDGGSRAYTFPDKTIIKAKEYKIFGRQDTKLALNNTSDEVRYMYADGTIIDRSVYESAIENASYVRDADNIWVWTSVITPGEENILTEVKEKETKKVSKSNMIKPIITTTLEKIRNEDIGDMVKVVGTVAVEPGILGSQYFYIVGSPGIQVYSYKKDFPKLKIGDKIEVTGEISEINGEARLKISSKDDIKVLENIAEPVSKKIEIFEVNESHEGFLVEISGEVTEIKTSYMYLDDGSDEVKVYFKSGTEIDKKKINEGDLLSVTGVVSQTKEAFQILPRSQKDIKNVGISEDFSEKQKIDKKENTQDLAEKYLTATAGGLTAIFFGLFAKNNSSKIEDLVAKIRKKT